MTYHVIHHRPKFQAQDISQLSCLTCCISFFNSLYTGNPLMGTLANSEDPDEMQHNGSALFA